MRSLRVNPKCKTALSPHVGISLLVARAWVGLRPKGCQSHVGNQRKARWRRTHVTERPELRPRIALRARSPTTQSRGARAVPSGYDPPANERSNLAPGFTIQHGVVGSAPISARASTRAPSYGYGVPSKQGRFSSPLGQPPLRHRLRRRVTSRYSAVSVTRSVNSVIVAPYGTSSVPNNSCFASSSRAFSSWLTLIVVSRNIDIVRIGAGGRLSPPVPLTTIKAQGFI